nr:metallophosphoesterase [Gemmatimonadales bacterium]
MAAVVSAKWERWHPRLLALYAEGHTHADVASALSTESGQPFTPAACRQKYAEMKGQMAPEQVHRPMIQRPRVSQIIELNPQPFAVPIPRVARSNHGHDAKCWTALIFTDTHVPYQDEAALSVVYGLIRDVQPRVIVHLGDLLDCFKISRFTKDRNHILNTQDEIDGARRILHHVSELAPQARKVWLEGNHEHRLDELLNSLPGTASDLTRLRSIQQAMTWPALLG